MKYINKLEKKGLNKVATGRVALINSGIARFKITGTYFSESDSVSYAALFCVIQ